MWKAIGLIFQQTALPVSTKTNMSLIAVRIAIYCLHLRAYDCYKTNQKHFYSFKTNSNLMATLKDAAFL